MPFCSVPNFFSCKFIPFTTSEIQVIISYQQSICLVSTDWDISVVLLWQSIGSNFFFISVKSVTEVTRYDTTDSSGKFVKNILSFFLSVFRILRFILLFSLYLHSKKESQRFMHWNVHWENEKKNKNKYIHINQWIARKLFPTHYQIFKGEHQCITYQNSEHNSNSYFPCFINGK